MSIYADSSVLASVYVLDVHTPAAVKLLARQPDVWVTPFHEAEVAHVISQGVFRGRFSQQQANSASQSFQNDCDAGVWHRIAFPPNAFAGCVALARQRGARVGSRTLDSLHVACALELKAQRFWTFDQRQAKVAKAAGLKLS